jgi:hypothetical protein
MKNERDIRPLAGNVKEGMRSVRHCRKEIHGLHDNSGSKASRKAGKLINERVFMFQDSGLDGLIYFVLSGLHLKRLEIMFL